MSETKCSMDPGAIVTVKGDDREWVVVWLREGFAYLREKGWTELETSPGRCPHHKTVEVHNCTVIRE